MFFCFSILYIDFLYSQAIKAKLSEPDAIGIVKFPTPVMIQRIKTSHKINFLSICDYMASVQW